MLPRSRLVTVALVALIPASSAAAYAAGVGDRAAPATATRDSLAQAVDPVGAHGRTLGLSRVTIPAHTRLALHHHVGTQIAYVSKGALTYTVKAGSVPVYRGAADQHPRLVRRVRAGHSGTVRSGEWVVEQPRVIHFGANNGNRPLVILLATLFTNGSPPSVPVPDR